MSPALRRAFVRALGVALAFGLAAPAYARHPIRAPAAAGQPLAAPAADFDGDGRADQARLDKTSGTITLRLSSADVPLALDARRLGGAPLAGAAIHDVDVDGDPDVLALTTTGRLIVWRNSGGGHLSPRITGPPTIEGISRDGHGVRPAHRDRSIAPASLAPVVLLPNCDLVGHVRVALPLPRTHDAGRPAPRTTSQQLPRPPPAAARV